MLGVDVTNLSLVKSAPNVSSFTRMSQESLLEQLRKRLPNCGLPPLGIDGLLGRTLELRGKSSSAKYVRHCDSPNLL
jgi:hypothetical protein